MNSLYNYVKNLASKQLVILLIVTAVLVYFNSLFGGFISDDLKQIQNNNLIHSISNLFTFFKGSTFDAGGNILVGLFYRPMQVTYFSLIWNIFGVHPFFFHLFQLIFHIINAILIFFLFTHFFNKTLVFFLSLIFIVHPINVEAVSYISSSGILISVLFGLLAFRIGIKNTLNFLSYIYLFIFLLLSALFHESGILFIPLIILFQLIYKKEKAVSCLKVSILVFVVYAVLRFVLAHIYFPRIYQSPIMVLPLPERLLNMPSILFFYLQTFAFPMRLGFSQVWVVSKVDYLNFYVPLIILFFITLGLGSFAYFLHKTRDNKIKLFSFFTAWLLIGLALYIQIIPAEQTVSERWFYLPMIGLLGIVGVIIQYFINKKGYPIKEYLIVLAFLSITLLSVRSFIRNNNWGNEFTLATHDIAYDPDNYVLANMLGAEYLRRGDTRLAIIYLEKSASQFVDAQTLSNLGAAYYLNGDYGKSRTTLQRSIEVNESADAITNLAWLLATKGDPTEAEVFIQNKLKKYPNLWKLWMDLAIAKYKLHKNEDALQAAKQAYLLSQNEQTVYLYNQINQNLPLKID